MHIWNSKGIKITIFNNKKGSDVSTMWLIKANHHHNYNYKSSILKTNKTLLSVTCVRCPVYNQRTKDWIYHAVHFPQCLFSPPPNKITASAQQYFWVLIPFMVHGHSLNQTQESSVPVRYHLSFSVLIQDKTWQYTICMRYKSTIINSYILFLQNFTKIHILVR